MRRFFTLLAAGALVAALGPSTALAGKTTPTIISAETGTVSATEIVIGTSITCSAQIVLHYAAGGGVKWVEVWQDGLTAPYRVATERSGWSTVLVSYSVSGAHNSFSPHFTAGLSTGRAAVTTPVELGYLTADTDFGCVTRIDGVPTLQYP